MDAIDMLNVLLIIVVAYVQLSQTSVRRQLPGITWNRARDQCKPYGLENRDDFLQKSVISNEREFWIGKAIYKKLTPWIELIGCLNFAYSHLQHLHSVDSIGNCKQKCDSENMGSYFGYRERHHINCACLPHTFNKRNRRSIKDCINSAYFFVYNVYTGKVPMSSDPGNCTTICCGNCNMLTKNDNQLEGRRCSSVDKRIAGRCGTRMFSMVRWDLDYFGSLEFCMNENRLLPTSNYCQRNNKHDGQMTWTNVFREEVEIIKTKDFDNDPVRCFSGVFTLVKGRRTLKASEHSCTEIKNWFVCKTNSPITESITESSFFTIKSSKDKQITIPSGQSLTLAKDKTSLRSTGVIKTETITRNPLFTLATSKVTQTHTSQGPSFNPSRMTTNTTARKTIRKTGFTNNKREHGDNSTSIGAVIGGILGACCILFVSAVLIVCKIRSKGIFKETTKSVKEDTNQIHFSNTIYQDSNNTSDRTSAMPTSNQTYGLDGTSTPVYAEVNKSKKQENLDETYTDAGYGEYDHLHDIQNRKTCPQENIYDSHGAPRNEEDQTYDSSDFGKGKWNEGNDLYDHSVVEGNYMSNGNHDSHNSKNANIYDKAS